MYSTLTTDPVSISNYNHDVNLFLFMAYWLPSFIPSSIIFEDCFLLFDDVEFTSQSGHQIQQRDGKLVHKNQVKHGDIAILQLFSLPQHRSPFNFNAFLLPWLGKSQFPISVFLVQSVPFVRAAIFHLSIYYFTSNGDFLRGCA